MNLESQVCSLELAKKLKELGIKGESQFYFVNPKSIGDHILENEVWMIAHQTQISGLSELFISAFTVAELGEMLPEHYGTIRDLSLPDSLGWKACGINGIVTKMKTKSSNEANTRAKMLIYLIENGLYENDQNKSS